MLSRVVPYCRSSNPQATLGPLHSAAALWQADEMCRLYSYFDLCVQVLTFETYVLTYVHNFYLLDPTSALYKDS